MPEADFDVSIAPAGSMSRALVAGILSGTGTHFLRATSLAPSGDYRIRKTGVSSMDHAVTAFFRSPNGGDPGCLLRASSLSPLTGYWILFDHNGTITVGRVVSGTITVLSSGVPGGVSGTGVSEMRASILGNVIKVEKRIAGAFVEQLSVADPSPITTPGSLGLDLHSGDTGLSSDVDDLTLAPVS